MYISSCLACAQSSKGMVNMRSMVLSLLFKVHAQHALNDLKHML
jgi:hypothetical protein